MFRQQAEVGRALLTGLGPCAESVGLCEGEAAHIGLWSSSGTHVLVPALPLRPPVPPLGRTRQGKRNRSRAGLAHRAGRKDGIPEIANTAATRTRRRRQRPLLISRRGRPLIALLPRLAPPAAARASGTHNARLGQGVPTDDTNLSPRLAWSRVPALYRQTRLCGEMPARRSRACVAGRLGRDSILWRCLFVGDDPRATEEAARLYTGGQAQRVPLR